MTLAAPTLNPFQTEDELQYFDLLLNDDSAIFSLENEGTPNLSTKKMKKYLANLMQEFREDL